MIKVTGISQTIKQLEIELEAKRKTAFKEEVHKTLSALKANTPVDTGEARDGWYATDHSIENNVEHVKYLNEGSSQQAPEHFIEQTIINNPNLIVKGIIVREK
jgi:hypothetical protein